MEENKLVLLSKEFAVDLIKQINKMKENKTSSVLTNQLLRSGTSIGANIHEGNYASSRADFINKFQIALKECFETEYWLEIFYCSNIIEKQDYELLIRKCSTIRFLLSKSINTAKGNE